MKFCDCCGQEIRFHAQPLIQVDDALLALCNRAHDEAARRTHTHVEIAHVVWCLTGWSAADGYFAGFEIRREALADAAYQWLAMHADTLMQTAPKTSADLAVLLQRAEAIATRDARAYATPLDFVEALVRNSRDLHSAEFIDWVSKAQHRTHRTEISSQQVRIQGRALSRSINDEAADRRVTSNDHTIEVTSFALPQARVSSDIEDTRGASAASWEYAAGRGSSDSSGAKSDTVASRPPHDQRSGSIDAASIKFLIERLDRQDRLLAEIRIQLAQSPERHHRRAGPPADAQPFARTMDTQNAPRTGRSKVDAGNEPAASTVSRKGQDLSARLVWRQRVRRQQWPKQRRDGFVGTAATNVEVSSPTRMSPVLRPALSIIHSVVPDRNLRHDEETTDAISDIDADDGFGAPGDREKRFYLAPGDDIVRAPSIGNRTAARLGDAGILRVRDLLNCNADDIAQKAGGRFITSPRIADWQVQARLVCTIPWLRGTHAQLLVGAGYRTIADIEAADGKAVWAAISKFAMTRDGQSVLRSSPPPDAERVALWVQHASLAEPARAA